MPVTGHHARLGTRLLARLCRGRHLRRLSSTRLQGATLFEPGVELYYNVNDVGRPGRLANQELFAGPVVAGAYALGWAGLPGKVKYEVGYLFGATEQSSRGAVRWRFEYELSF